MPSITIELTDEEYQTAQVLPASEQRRALLAAANQYATARNEAPDEPTSEEDLIAIGEALADVEAGRVVDSDAFFKSLEEKHGWKL